ncbi:MAG: sigma-70 family RNA polymerase sigma factor [Eubacterium sp.]|nr:sigma-70 family RNA polymerase sigma factor [Eubacterium sp.]
MEDERIIQLYWDRDEKAIEESSVKYGAYCMHISRNILQTEEDAEECVNDTWLHAWNSLPPQKPSVLSAFLGKLTRNLAFDRYRKLHRKKRGGHSVELVLDELGEIVSGKDDPEGLVQEKELKEAINQFLLELPEEKRVLFIKRYWYSCSISEIAEAMGMSSNSVSVNLNRLRQKLKGFLYERGYEI